VACTAVAMALQPDATTSGEPREGRDCIPRDRARLGHQLN
jgi:hypothetical protein